MQGDTPAVHGGFGGDSPTGAGAVPVYQTVSYAYKAAQELADVLDGKSPRYIYRRIGNPAAVAEIAQPGG